MRSIRGTDQSLPIRQLDAEIACMHRLAAIVGEDVAGPVGPDDPHVDIQYLFPSSFSSVDPDPFEVGEWVESRRVQIIGVAIPPDALTGETPTREFLRLSVSQAVELAMASVAGASRGGSTDPLKRVVDATLERFDREPAANPVAPTPTVEELLEAARRKLGDGTD